MNPIQSSTLSTLPGLTHGFYLKNELPQNNTSILYPHQTHTTKVISVTTLPSSPLEADGLVTTLPHLCIGIRTADCVPLLLCDPQNQVIGAIHAGWRGALGGICEEAIDGMVQAGATLSKIKAAIGPSIMQNSYEVGPEVYEKFLQKNELNKKFFVPSSRASHFYFDLPGYVASCLFLKGLKDIDHLGINTYEDDRFFSYRRACHQEKTPQKRCNVSIIALSEDAS